MRLRVALVEPVGGHGGMDYYDERLAQAVGGAGVEVELYTAGETMPVQGAEYGQTRCFRGIYGRAPRLLRGILYLAELVSALLWARARGAGIAHYHFFGCGWSERLSVAIAKAFGFVTVVTAHDVESLAGGGSAKTGRKVYGGADGIITHSAVARREMARLGLGNDSNIAAIPLGHYVRTDLPCLGTSRELLHLPDDRCVVLFFGQIKRVKGLDVLLEAMPRVIADRPDVLLVVAGRPWKEDMLVHRQTVDAHGLTEHVKMDLRFIPDADAVGYYMSSDLVVLPYRRVYQSAVLLMAMSYGRPVLVSDVESMREEVVDRENGLLFKSGDAGDLATRLLEALSDPVRLKALGEAARTSVLIKHDWAKIGELTRQTYEDAWRRRRGGSGVRP